MKLALAAALIFALVACSPKTADTAETPSPDGAPAMAVCPNNGPRLVATGVCVDDAITLLSAERISAEPAPGGCTWTMNDALLPGGDQAVLFRALSCNGRTTSFEAGAGAHSASLYYETSALFGDGAKGREIIRLFPTGFDNPQRPLQEVLREEPAAVDCEIRPAGIPGWPADALVIAPKAEALARRPEDEQRYGCGPLGVDDSSQMYWRIGPRYAWFFDLGQEAPDFDPASIILMQKATDGSWSPAA